MCLILPIIITHKWLRLTHNHDKSFSIRSNHNLSPTFLEINY